MSLLFLLYNYTGTVLWAWIKIIRIRLQDLATVTWLRILPRLKNWGKIVYFFFKTLEIFCLTLRLKRTENIQIFLNKKKSRSCLSLPFYLWVSELTRGEVRFPPECFKPVCLYLSQFLRAVAQGGWTDCWAYGSAGAWRGQVRPEYRSGSSWLIQTSSCKIKCTDLLTFIFC